MHLTSHLNQEDFYTNLNKVATKLFKNHPNAPVSKVYKDIISTKPETYYRYEDFKVPISIISDIKVHRYINRGKYCEAYMGSTSDKYIINELTEKFPNKDSIWFDQTGRLLVLLKCLKRIPLRKIQRETLILKNLCPNNSSNQYINDREDRKYIIPLLGVITSPLENGILDPIFVYPFIKTKNINIGYFRDKVKTKKITLKVILRYIYCLCRSLRACHRAGIMHRDVKPHNIAYDDKKDIFFLLDFGLAEFYQPKQSYTTRVASRHYKAPELLLGMEYYDYGIDVWGVGVIFAGFVLGKEPLFREATDEKMIYKVATVLGSEEVRDFVKKYKLTNAFEKEMEINGSRYLERKKWEDVDQNSGFYLNDECKRIFDRTLKIDPADRITIDELLDDNIFNEVKD